MVSVMATWRQYGLASVGPLRHTPGKEDTPMTERTTKALLAAIALGLWANLALSVFETRMQAQAGDLGGVERYLRQIANGTCTNSKIC